MSETVAALFVDPQGPYRDFSCVEMWTGLGDDDARYYSGPNRVIAHPPCERWGRYWSGGPSASIRKKLGDDKGCFAAALWSVRTFGGVLEHPEASKAWEWFSLPRPNRNGGWTEPDKFGGRSCCVEQGHYGHRARKATWLYGVGIDFRELKWGKAGGRDRLDEGFHSKEHRAKARANGQKPIKRLSDRENLLTPTPFARLLIELVKGATEADG